MASALKTPWFSLAAKLHRRGIGRSGRLSCTFIRVNLFEQRGKRFELVSVDSSKHCLDCEKPRIFSSKRLDSVNDSPQRDPFNGPVDFPEGFFVGCVQLAEDPVSCGNFAAD